MATYLETIEKVQQTSLDALKQVQATQLSVLASFGDLVSDVPAFKPSAMLENLPTFAQLAELNASFTRSVLEQQKAYASQLAGLFTVTQRQVVDAADRAVQSAATAAANVK